MLIVLPQNWIVKKSSTSVVRGYRNARNLAGLNFSSAGIMYASTINQIYNFNPVEGIACFFCGNYNIIQGIRNLSQLKIFKDQYKQILNRAKQINIPTKRKLDIIHSYALADTSQRVKSALF